MKKVALILAFTIIAIGVFSQNILKRTALNAVKVINDSSVVIQLNDTTQDMIKKQIPVSWLAGVSWTAHDGTASVLSIDYSIDGLTWFDYPNMVTYTMAGATGSQSFGDVYGCEANFIRVYFDMEAGGKVATFTLKYNIKKQ